MTTTEPPPDDVILAQPVGPIAPFAPDPPEPWGFWATMGLSLAVLGVFVAVIVMVMLGFFITHHQLAVIFAGGILLGIARARSNSSYLTIALHAIWNTVAMIQIWVCVL